jgi:alanyl-tRNA synthetase
MKPQEIRTSFIDFFVTRGHTLYPPASLIPDAMSTTLFTIAGMEQFVPVFLGQEPAPAPRVVTVQRCLRVAGGKSDIDNVGRTGRHGTLLEMLGNFSFGEYYKREAIAWAWEYLTQTLRLPQDRLFVTVYVDDDEAADIWERDIGLPAGRISRFREDNFWDMGPTGPCGPSSEIFYDLGTTVGCGRADCGVGCPHCNRYIEFWNLVFQQYDRESGGMLHPLPRKAIDTGMGFERLCMILAGKTSIFDTALYQIIIAALPAATATSPLPRDEQDVQRRIIADHARAAVFLAADGIVPSNTERGYVMRFLMRRALRAGRSLRLPDGFFSALVTAVTDSLADAYPELRAKQPATQALFAEEERLFDQTLERGESRLMALVAEATTRGESTLGGRAIFELHDTFGFPPELTAEIAREKGLEADMAGYRTAMNEQRERARKDAQAKRADVRVIAPANVDLTGSAFVGQETLEAKATIIALFNGASASVPALAAGEEGLVLLDRTPFYAERGGQMGDRGVIAHASNSFEVSDTQYQDKTYQRILHRGRVTTGGLRVGDAIDALVDPAWRREIRRHHSVTHLLQRALKEILGDAVAQRGSAVYPDHTRFDFDSPGGAMTKQQETQVEERVNALIRSDYHRSVEIMPFAQAVARGAVFMRGENYGDEVRVVTFGPSVELCGGTHVESTGEIGHFILTAESAIAAGIRRVEGVVSEAADRHWERVRDAVERAGSVLTTPVDRLADSVTRLAQERRELEKRIASLQAELAAASAARHVSAAREHDGVPYLAVRADDASAVRTLSDAIRSSWPKGVLAVAGTSGGKVSVLVTVSDELVARGVSAQDILAKMMTFVDGRGGGTASLAQGGGRNPAAIDAALAAVPEAIQSARG